MLVVLAALAAYGIVRLGAGEPQGTGVATTPIPTVQAIPPATLHTTSPSTVQGACGGEFGRPLITAEPLQTNTGLRVLTGGAQLAEVDVDSGTSRVRLGLHDPAHQQVQAIARGGDDVYVLLATCPVDGGRTRLYRLVDSSHLEPVRLSGPVDDLLGGPAGVFGLDYQSGNGRVVLRRVGGGEVRLPQGASPVGVTADGVVARLSAAAQQPPPMVLVDPDTGRVTHRYGHGRPLAIGGGALLWIGGDCRLPGDVRTGGPEGPCRLHRTSLVGGHDETYRLPHGRLPLGWMTVSRDGQWVAFQLIRAHRDPRFDTGGHPFPPSQIAVLNVAAHWLHVLPGLELAPKSGAGLAFSPDGDWLVVTVNEGSHGHLLVWRRGWDELRRAPGRLAGPLGWSVPVAVLDN